MSLRLLPLIIAAALSTSAYANDEHHQDATKKPAVKQSAKTVATPVDTEKQFTASRESMKKMFAQMEKIRQTKDPVERQRLMHEHIQSMHEGAQSMRSTGGGMMKMMECPMMSDQGAAQGCPMMGGETGKMDISKQMKMMENRMDMMQMMMEQMIEHEQQKSQLP